MLKNTKFKKPGLIRKEKVCSLSFKKVKLISKVKVQMRFSLVVSALVSKANVATALGSDPVYADTVESEGRQMKQC